MFNKLLRKNRDKRERNVCSQWTSNKLCSCFRGDFSNNREYPATEKNSHKCVRLDTFYAVEEVN